MATLRVPKVLYERAEDFFPPDLAGYIKDHSLEIYGSRQFGPVVNFTEEQIEQLCPAVDRGARMAKRWTDEGKGNGLSWSFHRMKQGLGMPIKSVISKKKVSEAPPTSHAAASTRRSPAGVSIQVARHLAENVSDMTEDPAAKAMLRKIATLLR